MQMNSRASYFRFLLSVTAAILAALAPPPAAGLPVESVTPVNNRDYSPAVRRVIQNAQKSLYIQLYQTRFYEEYPDTASNHFLTDIVAAAKRGVTVKIVIDTGEWNQGQKNEHNLAYVERLKEAGVQVWEDSPVDVSHQKVILVDDDITLLGSFNWTYYSLANSNEVAAVIRSAPLNGYLKRYFYEVAASGRPLLNAKAVTEEDIPAFAPETSEQPLPVSGKRSIGKVAELPATDVMPIPNRLFYPAVHEALLNAKKSVEVVQRSIRLSAGSPAGRGPSLPGEPSGAVDVLVQDLVAAARRGVKVRVVLDYTENMNDPDNAETAAYLRARGVEVFQEDPKVQTHAKMLVIDDDKVVLGSTNWTGPAVERGNEVSVLITSPEVAAGYRRFVNGLIRKGKPYEARPSSIWQGNVEGP